MKYDLDKKYPTQVRGRESFSDMPINTSFFLSADGLTTKQLNSLRTNTIGRLKYDIPGGFFKTLTVIENGVKGIRFWRTL